MDAVAACTNFCHGPCVSVMWAALLDGGICFPLKMFLGIGFRFLFILTNHFSFKYSSF
jgi:hypothetical protein